MNRKADVHFHGPSRAELSARNNVAALLTMAVLFLFLPGSGIGQGSTDDKAYAAAPAGAERIHLGDVVDVDFVGSFEFDWRGKLTGEGFLDGLERAEKPVFALCRTEGDVAAEIAERHRYFLRDPKVVVRIVDRTDRALAYVVGGVRTPSRLRVRRPVSLLELIVLTGGITDTSNGEILIFRPPDVSCGGEQVSGPAMRKPQQLTIAIADLMNGKADANPNIVMGDIISVKEAAPVFVIGDVAAPRRMNLTPELTLTRAIAFAGGPGRSFSGQKARIHRRNPETKLIELDLRRVNEKLDDDPKLEPYDVIEVERKGFDLKPTAPISEPPSMNSDAMSRLPLRIVD